MAQLRAVRLRSVQIPSSPIRRQRVNLSIRSELRQPNYLGNTGHHPRGERLQRNRSGHSRFRPEPIRNPFPTTKRGAPSTRNPTINSSRIGPESSDFATSMKMAKALRATTTARFSQGHGSISHRFFPTCGVGLEAQLPFLVLRLRREFRWPTTFVSPSAATFFGETKLKFNFGKGIKEAQHLPTGFCAYQHPDTRADRAI